MAEFTGSQIRGDQLADEILLATGVDLGSGINARVIARPDDVLFIPDEFVPDQPTHDAIQAVIDVHVPDARYFQEDQDRYGSIEAAQAAVQAWKALPGWADWTVEQATTYIDTNVTDLATAKTVLIGMATVVIHIREVVEWLWVNRLKDIETPS